MTNVDTDENASVRAAFEEIDGDCDGLHTLESISHDGSIVILDDGSLWHVAGPDPTIVSWLGSTPLRASERHASVLSLAA